MKICTTLKRFELLNLEFEIITIVFIFWELYFNTSNNNSNQLSKKKMFKLI